MNAAPNEALDVIEGIVEEYSINGQHFTRSIRIPPQGGYCAEIFAVNGNKVADAQIWLALVDQVRSHLHPGLRLPFETDGFISNALASNALVSKEK